MEWNKLSMADRAKYIALGVQNGITSLDSIRESYNSYANGGDLSDEEINTRLHPALRSPGGRALYRIYNAVATTTAEDIDNYVDNWELPVALLGNAATVGSFTPAAPVAAPVAIGSNVLSAGMDLWQIGRGIYNKDWGTVTKNSVELGLSLLGQKGIQKALIKSSEPVIEDTARGIASLVGEAFPTISVANDKMSE